MNEQTGRLTTDIGMQVYGDDRKRTQRTSGAVSCLASFHFFCPDCFKEVIIIHPKAELPVQGTGVTFHALDILDNQ